jgi:hypothetical protein
VIPLKGKAIWYRIAWLDACFKPAPLVTPAKRESSACARCIDFWIPAFAGMTDL